MENTDKALAALLDKVKDLSGPAYDMMLASVHAQAVVDIVQYVAAVIAIPMLLVLCIGLLKKAEAHKNSASNSALACGIGGFISGLACAVCLIATTIDIGSFIFAIQVVNHPELAIGKALLGRITQ